MFYSRAAPTEDTKSLRSRDTDAPNWGEQCGTNRCVEHDIGPDGSLIDNALKQKQKSDSKDVFFDESEEEKFIPRALSI